MTAVHVVVPDGIDDPARPSGGNAYDRHVCRGLTSIGWSVHEHAVPGSSRAALAGVVERIPDDAIQGRERRGVRWLPEAEDRVLVHRPAGGREPATEVAVIDIASARPGRVVDAVGYDEVHRPQSGRS